MKTQKISPYMCVYVCVCMWNGISKLGERVKEKGKKIIQMLIPNLTGKYLQIIKEKQNFLFE